MEGRDVYLYESGAYAGLYKGGLRQRGYITQAGQM